MSFLKKVKSFVQNKLPKKKNESHITGPEPLNKEIALLVSNRLSIYIRKPGAPPEGVTEKQWKKILNQIIWSWDHAYLNNQAKSAYSRKLHRIRVLVGFKYFVKYFKDIK
tara:strand:- start:426 stop:755 length:330 start_codon:yes stop_codon:yes gene_type:complete